jgi:DNA-binding transcriptional MerR regulator
MHERTFTLPELASLVGVEYRTLHTWVGRGLLAASCEQAQGSGTRNVFDRSDALEAFVLADLRRAGVELSKLEEVGTELRRSRERRTGSGDVLLINGSVSLSRRDDLVEAVGRTSPTLVYDLAHAYSGLASRLDALI